jgi:hypothetical protein
MLQFVFPSPASTESLNLGKNRALLTARTAFQERGLRFSHRTNMVAKKKKVRATRSRKRSTNPKDSKLASRLQVVALYRERQKLRRQIARDRERRYAQYRAKVQNPTEPPSPGVALRAVAPAAGKQNLRILAEGDSWFAYPLPILHGDGVIYQLQKLLGYDVANMAHAGLEVEQMMGLSIRQDIIKRLSDPGIRFDALLFSGGGDDIVGDRFCIWLKDAPPVPTPDQMLDLDAVNAVLAVLESEFRELVDIRDQYSPQTIIFVNAYDFPPVTGIGVCGEGPWLKPSLDYAYKHMGVANPDPQDEFLVVKTMLQMFGAMLARVAADLPRFVVVPTQGTLTPDNSDWQNEIHPSSAGFTKMARQFQASLSAMFP